MVIQLDSMVVTVLRDASPDERGFDKRCPEKQVHILVADGSTRIVPVSALTVDGVKSAPPAPKPVAPVAVAHPAAQQAKPTDHDGDK